MGFFWHRRITTRTIGYALAVLLIFRGIFLTTAIVSAQENSFFAANAFSASFGNRILCFFSELFNRESERCSVPPPGSATAAAILATESLDKKKGDLDEDVPATVPPTDTLKIDSILAQIDALRKELYALENAQHTTTLPAPALIFSQAAGEPLTREELIARIDQLRWQLMPLIVGARHSAKYNTKRNYLDIDRGGTIEGDIAITENLTVDGLTAFNGVEYTWPGADGNDGQVLTTDGSGGLSWETIPGGGGGSAADIFELFNGAGIRATTTGNTLLVGDNVSTSTPGTLWNQFPIGPSRSSLDVFHSIQGLGGPYQDTGLLINVEDPSVAFGFGSGSHTSYGIHVNNVFTGSNLNGDLDATGGAFWVGGDLGTAGNTSHTGVDIFVDGTADVNTGLSIQSYQGTDNTGLYVTAYDGVQSNIGIFASAYGGVNNYGLFLDTPSGSNNWALYENGGAQSYFSGNVGIGTTTPFAKLSVRGANGTTGDAPVGFAAFGGTGGTGPGAFGFGKTGGAILLRGGTGGNGSGGSESGSGGDIYIDAGIGGTGNETATGKILLSTNVNANVGIGTTNPTGKLDVAGDVVAQYFTATSTTATSTFANHISIASGAEYRIDGIGILTRQGSAIIAGDLTGDARGTNALDIQSSRIANTQVASGAYSVAVGLMNTASNGSSIAIGSFNGATGASGSAVGFANTAGGYYTSAFGYMNTASGDYSSAFGYRSMAVGNYSTAAGYKASSTGLLATSIGFETTAAGNDSLAVGKESKAIGTASAAIGVLNLSSGVYSMTVGGKNTASGDYSSAAGYRNTASGYAATALGYENRASAERSVALGHYNTTDFYTGMAIGAFNNAAASTSLGVGYANILSSEFTTGVGHVNDVGGLFSGAFGYNNGVNANNAIAIGNNLTNHTASSTMIGPSDEAKLTILGAPSKLGYVGIGTTTPTAMLQVNPVVGTSRITHFGVATSSLDVFAQDFGNDASHLFISHNPSTSSNYHQGLMAIAEDNALNNWVTVGGEGVALMTHNAGTRYYGIGLEGDAYNVNNGDTENLIGVVGYVENKGNGNVIDAASLRSYSAYNNGAGSITNVYGLYLDEQSAGNNDYQIYSTGTNPFVIVSGSNAVGIGTTTPREMLAVVGNVYATGNFISNGTTLTVPDYVFEDGYGLTPLSALQAYTQINKHLPDVPSELDIKKNGLNITTFALALLQKVEEITLYLFDHESRIVKLEAAASMWAGNAIKSLTADKVETKELCIDDVCITKEQLQELLDNADVAPTIPTVPSVPPPADEAGDEGVDATSTDPVAPSEETSEPTEETAAPQQADPVVEESPVQDETPAPEPATDPVAEAPTS